MMTLALLVCGILMAMADDAAQPVQDPQLQLELVRRAKTDQEVRKAAAEWMKKHGQAGDVVTANLTPEHRAEYEKMSTDFDKVDKGNTEWLKQTVHEQGWPTIDRVGKDGADAAWLLVQHADADPKFQRACLDLMTKLPGDQVLKSKVAYLTDRVLLAEGKRQVYGTQFTHSDGKWNPRPLEDEANVDRRRSEVGLLPLAEYIEQLESAYGVKPAK